MNIRICTKKSDMKEMPIRTHLVSISIVDSREVGSMMVDCDLCVT